MAVRYLLAALGASFGVSVAGPASADCNGAPAPCEIASGTYDIRLPETSADAPVVMFLHGYGGDGMVTMNKPQLVDPLLARGYAVIAPDGLPRGGDGPNSWAFRPRDGARDETAFLTDVARDAARRFGVSDTKVILAGFSAGAFMVSYLACKAPQSFAAYAPVSGGFWHPYPDHCDGPVRLFQTHGWADSVVPLEGRPLGNGTYRQGDIWAGMEIWRAANACPDDDPSGISTTGDFMRRQWSDCAPGSDLEFALFPGGHVVPAGWADMILDWYEAEDGSQAALIPPE
ncbi:MAG: polyhydroxybutyrate depolymerase [Rhodobacteraceae bacterium]|nr:polyhydroxybutyrate depolymerase [Paracoccaceae bacterium]MAY45424.1 polyhydroxybutyrate depolymerase [Paracoccaceae bacterium]